MDHLPLALQPAGNAHHPGGQDLAAEGLELRRPDDDVGGAGLVLQGDEDDALGGARPLAHQHQAGDRDAPPVLRLQELLRRQVAAHLRAQQRHRMRPQREPQRPVVGDHRLAIAHRRQDDRRFFAAFRLPRRIEQRQRRRAADGLDRPQRRAPAQPHRAEGVGLGQPGQRRRRHAGAAPDRQRLCIEVAARGRDPFGIILAETLDLAQAEAQRIAAAGPVRLAAGLQRAVPVRAVDVGRAHLDAVLAGVAHDLRRGVEAHRLAVQERAGEDRRVVALQPGRDIDQEREARRVALREAVLAEALDLAEAALGEVARVAARHHAVDHLLAEGVDRAAVPEGRHGAAQPVGLGRGEAGGDDGDLHRLLLEQRHAQRLAQHPAQLLRREVDRLLAVAAAQIGVDHVALDRPGADDRHLDDEVVEIARPHARQEGELGAALHLEHADRIGVAQHVVDRRILGRHGGEVQVAAVMAADQLEPLAQAGEHAERQHVDLEDPQRVEVVLVPFDDGAVLHRRVLDRHQLVEPAAGDDEAADMLREVPREADQLPRQRQRLAQPPVLSVEAELGQPPRLDHVADPGAGLAGQRGDDVARQPHRLADVAHRAARPVVDHGGGHAGALAAVLAVDVLDHLLAPLMLEIDVDIRRLAALGRDEALEQQVHAGRVDRGDAQAVADRRVGGRAAALAEDAPRAREADDVVHGQEIGGVIELADQFQLMVDLRLHLVRQADGPAAARALFRQRLQHRLRRPAVRRDLVRILVAQLVEAEAASFGDRQRLRQRIRPAAEQRRHRRRPLDMALAVLAEQPGAGFVDRHALAHAGQHVGQRPPRRRVHQHVVGRDQPGAAGAGEIGEMDDAAYVVAMQQM